MRVLRFIAVLYLSFILPVIAGGFVFGIFLGVIATVPRGDWLGLAPSAVFGGMMSAIFAIPIFFIPGLLYAIAMGCLAVFIADPWLRKRLLLGVALLAGPSLFPAWLVVHEHQFDDFWFVIGLISLPTFVIAALLSVAAANRVKPRQGPPCLPGA
jgi:hypothetical protein